jgi:hypothetical protein
MDLALGRLRDIPPLQGLGVFSGRFPGRCPGLSHCAPLGRKTGAPFGGEDRCVVGGEDRCDVGGG